MSHWVIIYVWTSPTLLLSFVNILNCILDISLIRNIAYNVCAGEQHIKILDLVL